MFAELRHDLTHYTRATLTEILGARAIAALDHDEVNPALMAARMQITPETILARLLWFGDVVSDEEIVRALPTAGTNLPFLNHDDSGFRSTYQIMPFTHADSVTGVETDYYFATDPGSLQGKRHADDHVMGIGGATRTLASLAGYEPGQRVLDLGTGCGIHAIIAARAGADVVATDISQRALDYARFNAELNGVQIDLRRGSLLEPVAGETFDVIVSNPPFVITPSSVRDGLGTMEYRDGGADGDSLAAQILGAAQEHLTPGGMMYMLANWEIAGEKPGVVPEPWHARPASWFVGTDLDALVIQRESTTPDAYVSLWLGDGGLRPGHPDYSQMFQAWLADFDARGVGAIGFGYIVAGRPDTMILTESESGGDPSRGRQPVRSYQAIPGAAPTDLHRYVRQVWANLPFVVDEAFWSQRLAKNDVVEHRFLMPGEEDPFLIKFTQTNGFGEEVVATTALAGFVSVCDGELNASQILAALSALLGAEESHLRAELTPLVRALLERAMLVIYPPNVE